MLAHGIGFQWLVQIIHGTLADLGYSSPELPSVLRLGGHTMSNICLLAQGRKAGSSYVYQVDTDEGQAILKLNHTECEVRYVIILQAIDRLMPVLDIHWM